MLFHNLFFLLYTVSFILFIFLLIITICANFLYKLKCLINLWKCKPAGIPRDRSDRQIHPILYEAALHDNMRARYINLHWFYFYLRGDHHIQLIASFFLFLW